MTHVIAVGPASARDTTAVTFVFSSGRHNRAVRAAAWTVTRRSLLLGAVATAAGCRHAGHLTAMPPADVPAVRAAAAAERALIAGFPPGDAAAGVHEVHLRALLALLPSAAPSPAASTSPAGQVPPPAPTTDATALARAGVPSLQAAAVAAVDGRTAALLASIAAEHAAASEPAR